MLNKDTKDWLNTFREEDDIFKKLDHKCVTISVTAGKGGVGKTSAALKWSLLLAEQGKKVLLIDCDFNLSNTTIKLGLPLNDNFVDLISGRKSFSSCLYKKGNLSLLSGCNGSIDLLEKGSMLESFITEVISHHKHKFDVVILDCPAGISSTTLILGAYCDHRFIIVTPDKSSITDSYSLIKIMKTKYGITENHLIVNKVESKQQYKKVVRTISETVENYLSCRTVILGGVKKYEGNIESFDQMLLAEKNSIFHKNFLKILDRFSEQDGGDLQERTILGATLAGPSRHEVLAE